MLLGRDRVLVRHLHQFERLDADLVAAGDAGGALVGAHFAGDDHRRLLRQLAGDLELVRLHVLLEGDALGDARSVAQLDELQAPFVGAVVNPAAHGHFFTDVLGEFCD